MATKKSAAPKESWAYIINNGDECYRLFNSRASALKTARDEIQDYYYNDKEVTVNVYQKVEVVKFNLNIEEVSSVVTKKVATAKEIK